MMRLSKSNSRMRRRRGVTLLELLVVVTLMGTLSTVVVTRYGRDIFGDMGARSDAHRLWLDLQRAKSLAIRNGTSCSIVFDKASNGKLAGYKLLEESTTSLQKAVVEVTAFTSELKVSTSTPSVEFTFEGHATTASTITLQGPNRSWVLNVVPLSGAVNISEL